MGFRPSGTGTSTGNGTAISGSGKLRFWALTHTLLCTAGPGQRVSSPSTFSTYPSAAGDGRTRGVATQLPPALLARSQTNNVGNVVVDRINEGEAISPRFAQQQ